MSYLWVKCTHGLPLEEGGHAAGVLVAQAGYQDGVKPVQMAAEVPEAGPGVK